MTMPASFHAFSLSHQIVLWLAWVVLILLAVARWKSTSLALCLERVLGAGLLLIWPMALVSEWQAGTLAWANALPCHLCDVAAVSGGIALWVRNRLAAEIVYFFGLAGTLQGLITPNLQADYPDPRFMVFFLLHAGVVVTAMHVVTSMRCPPRSGALLRMFGVTMIYAVSVAILNHLLGTNYGFLCHKPEQASLMDSLGPWPWYIGSMILLCLALYALLYLPFYIANKRPSKSV
jgi:hypothetical integral membrane protein (TIGR02206 family)